MQTSENVDQIAAALAAAQGAMEPPKKDRTVIVQTRTGGQYEFSYATLDSVIAAARGPLATNGIAFIQSPECTNGIVTVETRLIHKSGQWFKTELALKPTDFGPQALGSAISYVKRYALSAMLGLVADEDEDGNLAEGNEAEEPKGKGAKNKPVRRPQPNPPAREASPTQGESQAAAFAYAEKVLGEAGVAIVPMDHRERPLYLSWLRGVYEQVMGREIMKILNLRPDELRSGADAIVKMIRDKAVEPWQPTVKGEGDDDASGPLL